MDTFTKIKEWLKTFPDIKYEIKDDRLTIFPKSETGFSVWILDNQSGYTVGYDGWHEEFETEEEALNCFKLGLSKECQLKTISRGNFPYKWILEHKIKENNQWMEYSETVLLLFPFWKKKKIVYLQNDIADTTMITRKQEMK